MNLLTTEKFKRDTKAIRDVFQDQHSPSLERRKKIVLLSCIGLINGTLVTLKQTGVIKKLPDFPSKIFDANSVTVSQKAFEMGLPDGPMASFAYSGIMILATFGGKKGLRRTLIVDKFLLGATAINAAFALQYFLNMVFCQKKICGYCITAFTINMSMVPPAWREAFSKEGS